MGVEELCGYCEKIQAKDPDIVVLTGDIFDERTEKSMMEEAAAALGNINAKYGVYYIWGNHDPNHYSEQAEYSMEELRRVLNGSRIRVLEDEAVQVTPELAVIGRMEQSLDRNRKSVQELGADLEPGSYKVVLDHRPVDLEENAAAGVDLAHRPTGRAFGDQRNELRNKKYKGFPCHRQFRHRRVGLCGADGWAFRVCPH